MYIVGSLGLSNKLCTEHDEEKSSTKFINRLPNTLELYSHRYQKPIWVRVDELVVELKDKEKVQFSKISTVSSLNFYLF